MSEQTTNVPNAPESSEKPKEDRMQTETQTTEQASQPKPKQSKAKAKDGKPTGRGAKATKAKGSQTVASKAQAKASPKREGSMAEWLDQQLQKGTTWDALLKAAQAEAEKRGVKTFTRMGEIKAHARFRAKSARWNVEFDDKKVKMKPITK